MLYKLQQTLEILNAKGEHAALRFAAKLGCLGTARDTIQKGASALGNPAFYREIGNDPDRLIQEGIAAMRELLGVSQVGS